MRIVFFADIRFPLERANGIQTFHTCCALARRGHLVTLVVRPDTARPPRDPFDFYGEARIPGLDVDRLGVLGPPALRRACWLAQAVSRAIKARGADVVVTRDLGLASLLLRLPRQLRSPLVYESHGFAPTFGASLDEMLTNGERASSAKQRRLAAREARAWQRAEGYITITRGLATELSARLGPRGALAVIPDGAHVPAGAAPPPAVPHDPPVVGYAGHLYPWKGVDVLLEALAQLPGVAGVIVGGLAGEPDLERTRARVRALGIEERVRMTGAVAPPDVAGLLAGMDVVVLPNTATHVSARYTSPLKLFEYMAAGRPIVASNLPALREVLEDGHNALLVEPGDAGAMARAIARLVGDPGLRARLAATAWRDVQAYGWERRGERMEALLASVVSRPRTVADREAL